MNTATILGAAALLLALAPQSAAEFVVWVAPNVGSATLVLRADGAGLSHCTSPRLRPGTTSAVMCLVQTDTDLSDSAFSTDVVVQTSNFGVFSHTFTHALTG